MDLRAVIDSDRLAKCQSAGTDYLPGRFTAWGAREYVLKSNGYGLAVYISPLNYPFYTQDLPVGFA